MANSDYTINGQGYMCSTAFLSTDITQLQTAIVVTNLVVTDDDAVVEGAAILIGDEVCRLDARSGNNLTIARGCADTIPATHPAGTIIYLIEDSVGTNNIEYAPTETIAVKLMPSTAGSGTLAIEESPPNNLTFNWRFARPYPAANLKVNAVVFYTPVLIDATHTPAAFTWVHRDRTVQADQLVSHTEAGTGLEAGATYRFRVYSSSGTLLATISGVTGTSWDYTLAAAQTDFGIASGGARSGYILMDTQRGSYNSWQTYRIDITVQVGQVVNVALGHGRGHGLAAQLNTVVPVDLGHAQGDGLLATIVAP